MDKDGIIFGAIPSKSNDYYKPFFADILSFHAEFTQKKATKDRVLSLAYTDC